MFESIQRMVHRIGNVFWDSDKIYSGDDIGNWENYTQTILQGNTSGTSILGALSSVIFDILHRRGFAVKLTTCLFKQLFLLVRFAYVDNYNLIKSGSNPLSVLESMRTLFDSWGPLMEVTGGALRTDKNWWYRVEYIWTRDIWVADDALINFDLLVITLDGTRLTIDRLGCDTASEILWI